ncbi:MAG TPA: DUF202 domain-containing protein [Pyrinomonadaceae bacterium]|nr:DUF202 domain-containing protein [Pyrinomonadaceae bacterium]
MPDLRNKLAEDRTELGYGRTILALERTMMAWIRTDLSLITFGFTLYKFLETMQQASGGSEVHGHASRNVGIALILLGVGTLIVAMVQFQRAMKKISIYSQTTRQTSLSMVTGTGILFIAAAMLLHMLGIWKG